MSEIKKIITDPIKLVSLDSEVSADNYMTRKTFIGGHIRGSDISLDSGGCIRSGQTAYNTGAGFFLGYDTDAYKLSMGDTASNKYFTYDGTDFTLVGGTITGGTIQTANSGKRVVLDGANNKIDLFDSNDNTVGQINGDPDAGYIIFADVQSGKSATGIYGRTQSNGYAAWFTKATPAGGDVADTADVVLIENLGQGKGLVVSNNNQTATKVNLDLSTNWMGQPRIAMGNETDLPTTGTHAVGDLIVKSGIMFRCITAGTPGTFTSVDGNYETYTCGESINARQMVCLGQSGTTNSSTATNDSYVDEPNPDTNYGSGNFMRVGTADADGNQYYETLLQFDISSLPDDVTQVLLKIDVYSSNITGTDSIEIGVYSVSASWDEGTVTWNNKPAAGSICYDTVSFDANSDGWVSFDITDLYLDWKTGRITNNGLYLKVKSLTVVDHPDYITFSSSESGYKPYLELTTITDTDKVFVASSANQTSTFNVIGIAVESGNADDIIAVQSSGIYAKMSGLTANRRYYLSTSGGISLTPGTYIKPIGRSLSTTKLLIDFGNGIHINNEQIGGTLASPTFANGRTIFTGFRPRKITISGSCGANGLGHSTCQGTQQEGNAYCIYAGGEDSAAVTVGKSDTRSFYLYINSSNKIEGTLTVLSNGYRVELDALNAADVTYHYLHIVAEE